MTIRHQSLARLKFRMMFSLSIRVKTKLSMDFKSQINSIKSKKVRNQIKEEVKKVLSYQSFIRNQINYLMRFKVCNRSRIRIHISILLYQKTVIQIISKKLKVLIIHRK